MENVRSNLVVLRGAMPGDPTRRELPSGSTVTQFDVTTPLGPVEPAGHVSVPVSWTDPPAASTAWLVAGEELVVVGTVRRRFFRVNGGTQSRTEVVAEQVIPARRAKAAGHAIAAAVAGLAS